MSSYYSSGYDSSNYSDSYYSGDSSNSDSRYSDYYQQRRRQGYYGPGERPSTAGSRSSRNSPISYSSRSSGSDDVTSYYSESTDSVDSVDSRITFKNVDARREDVFIPAGQLPQLVSQKDIQIRQPDEVPRPLPPKLPPAPRLEQLWQPDLRIIGSDAAAVVLDGFRKIAFKAVVKYRQEEDISGYLKYKMDQHFGSPWCCIYGGNFDSFITHDGGMFLYFKLEGKYGLLWRQRFK